MRFLVSFLFAFLGVLVLSSCAHKEKQVARDIASLSEKGGVEGIWFLQGTSSTRGPYNGELELRKAQDGTFDVVRVVTYINYFFDGLKVQEVWTGKAVASGNFFTINYHLKRADFILRLKDQRREADDFKEPSNIISNYVSTPNGLATQYSDKKVSSYSEWITTKRDLEEKPLWEDRRTLVDARDRGTPPAVQNVIRNFKSQIGFDKDSYVKSFSKKADFKSGKFAFVLDPTDFNFYRDHKDVIRVTNKITDDISITEAVAKRNAYSPTLEEKAEGYDRVTADRHLTSLGIIAKSISDSDGKLLDTQADPEAGLLTGMYLASQAMRYSVTKDKDALENVRKSLRGLFNLMDVTSDPRELAKTLMFHKPQKEIPEGWVQGEGAFKNILWLPGGDSTLLKGILHGFVWAHSVLPENEKQLRTELQEKVNRLIDLRVAEESPQERALAVGLAAILSQDDALKNQYIALFSVTNQAHRQAGFDSSFYWSGSADWANTNLAVINQITAIKIAQLLKETTILQQLQEDLIKSWVIYSPAQRYLLNIAAFGFAYKYGVRGKLFTAESSDQKFIDTLFQTKWGLREIPYPRLSFDVTVDHSLKPSWTLSPTPRSFWKPLSGSKPPVQSYYQGLYAFPAFELTAFDSGMIWKESAFNYRTSGQAAGVLNSGTDYLYAYWMARLVGLPELN